MLQKICSSINPVLRYLLTLILVLCCRIWLYAQETSSNFKVLDGSIGLSQNSVYSLFQDSKGFIWIGTAEGLNRYDGSEMKAFKSASDTATPFYIRDNIFEEDNRYLWFSSETGIWRYDRHNNQFQLKIAAKDYVFIPLSLESDGRLFYFDYRKGVVRFEIKTGKSQTYHFPFSPIQAKIHYPGAVKQGSFCWIRLYEDDGLWRLDTRNNSYHHFFPGQKMQSIASDGNHVWTVSQGKLLQISDSGTIIKTFPFNDLKPAEKICIVNDKQGSYWVSTTSDGLLKYDSAGTLLQQFRSNPNLPNALPSNYITTLLLDRQRNLWIGTDGGGLARLDLKPPTFSKFPDNPSQYSLLSDFFITALYEDILGNFWFSTLNGGLYRFNPTSGIVQAYPCPAQLQRINKIYPIGDHGLLLAGQTEYCYFKDGKFFTIPFNNVPKTRFFTSNIVSINASQFVAATSYGLLLIEQENKQWQGRIVPLSGYEKDPTTDIIAAAGVDNFWVSLAGKGIVLVHFDGKQFKIITHLFRDQRITSLLQDNKNKNILWAGTFTGLLQLNITQNTLRKIGVANGLLNEHIYGVAQDEQENIWVSTNAGLSRISSQGKIENFSQESGLQGNEFNSGVVFKNEHSGRISFGGVKGFNYFSVNSVAADSFRARLAIVKLLVNESEVPDSIWNQGTLRLHHSENALSFQIAVLDFTRPEANKIRYWLEGWDKKPIQGKPGIIRYANLPPGNYTFHVSAAGSNKLYSQETKVNIRIVPPFWKRGWFYVLAISFLIFIVAFSVYLFGQRKLKKAQELLAKQRLLENERQRISQDLHDELGGALTQITLLSSLIPMKKKDDEELNKEVNKISTIARGVTKSMGDIIWSLHPQDDSLAATLSYIREQSVQFLSTATLHYTIDFPADIPNIRLSGEQRRNLLLVTKEGLNNVVKHAAATEITLKCSLQNQRLNFTISDNGKGMSKANQRLFGNGLKNIKTRMQQIDGGVEWILPERGTILNYWLPLPHSEKK
ncbi:MAG: hypothetical protein JST36_05355 [Bacteroidetes bacterium]|nr:hypothetical protein [Bacteroidota bacterium]